jgi:hypothetical protein
VTVNESRENMLCLRPTLGVVHRSRLMNGYGIVDLVPIKRNSVLGWKLKAADLSIRFGRNPGQTAQCRLKSTSEFESRSLASIFHVRFRNTVRARSVRIGLAENNAVLAHNKPMCQKFEKERQFPAVRPGSDSLTGNAMGS